MRSGPAPAERSTRTDYRGRAGLDRLGASAIAPDPAAFEAEHTHYRLGDASVHTITHTPLLLRPDPPAGHPGELVSVAMLLDGEVHLDDGHAGTTLRPEDAVVVDATVPRAITASRPCSWMVIQVPRDTAGRFSSTTTVGSRILVARDGAASILIALTRSFLATGILDNEAEPYATRALLHLVGGVILASSQAA